MRIALIASGKLAFAGPHLIILRACPHASDQPRLLSRKYAQELADQGPPWIVEMRILSVILYCPEDTWSGAVGGD